ncbi:hypothetical protein GCM10022232_61710 [Streptomyces plumbiresistens]|uniref:Uncharacterized protein n=2 Tax=Streptomyces plumbiresistens TaxID=511811 RepID=A0ABP7SHV6_9ACTN
MAPAKTPPGAPARKDAGMGIRMLHRRTAHARAQAKAHVKTAPPAPPPQVPAFSATASTVRVPTDPATVLGRATAAVPTDLAATLRRATAVGIARIPTGLAAALRQAALHHAALRHAALRHAAASTRRRLDRRERDAVWRHKREASVWRLWVDLGRGYLALGLTLLPRSRPMPTFTVFTAVNEWPIDAPPRRHPNRRTPGPDATP